MDYTNIPLKELNEKIDMAEMAVALGYQEDRSKSWRGGRCFVLGTKDNHEDRIFIQRSRTNPNLQHFSSTTFDNGGNGAAMLVKHALDHNFIPDPLITSSNTLDFNINRKIAKVLCNQLAIPDEDRKKLVQYVPELKRYEPFNEQFAKDIMAPAINSSLFGKREINKDTFNSPTFKGTWYNTNREVDPRRQPSDLCFPCYRNDDSIGGLNFRYFNKTRGEHSSLLMTGSEHANTIWHSNIPDKIQRIFVAESEYDCMAHYQLNKNKPETKNTLYISHQGFLIPSQVDCVIDLMRKNREKLDFNNFKLLLGADNDTQGSRYDLQFIKSIAELKKGTFQLDMNSKSNSTDIIIGEKKDSNTISTTITVNANKYDEFKKLTQQYLNENTCPGIDVQFADQIKSVRINRPNNDRFANIALAELITNSDLLIKNVQREKSIEKDWNDDLKVLNKINDALWQDDHYNDLKQPKKMDYQLYRDLSKDCNFKVNTKELKQLLTSISDKIPNDPELVKKQEQEQELKRIEEEKYRQAQADTKASMHHRRS